VAFWVILLLFHSLPTNTNTNTNTPLFRCVVVMLLTRRFLCRRSVASACSTSTLHLASICLLRVLATSCVVALPSTPSTHHCIAEPITSPLSSHHLSTHCNPISHMANRTIETLSFDNLVLRSLPVDPNPTNTQRNVCNPFSLSLSLSLMHQHSKTISLPVTGSRCCILARCTRAR
jgi:hypothetical protein